MIAQTTEQAATIDGVWHIFLSIAAVVALVVAGLIVYVLVRFRRRSDDLPTPGHDNIPLELGYTAIPLLIVAVLFAITVVSLGRVEGDDADPDLTVDVTALQWQWRFAYPAHGITVTATEGEMPELVLPAGSSVRFELTSADVIHSFWIPGFRYKRDVFPQETTSFQVDIDEHTGFYENVGTCAEFCGLDHHKMRFSVRIVSPDEFERWATANSRQQAVDLDDAGDETASTVTAAAEATTTTPENP